MNAIQTITTDADFEYHEFWLCNLALLADC